MPASRPPDPPSDLLKQGVALHKAGKVAEAAKLYTAAAMQAIAAAPKNLDVRFALARARYLASDKAGGLAASREALAVAHETLPRLDQLAAATRHALTLDPGFAEAWRTLSMMVRRSAYDDEMAAMERLYRDPQSTAEQRMQLAFALGRGFDDLGRWPEAFEYFAAGNRLKRASIMFSLRPRLDEMAMLRRLFESPPPLPDRTPDLPRPIFVVGLPRSGKTSIEHVLARHPEVAGAGELEVLDTLVQAFIGTHRLDGPDARLADVPAAAFAALGADYLHELRRLRPDGRILVDTMPSNFRYAGFLRLALPGARIIHCVRDPLEHAVALFQKFFAAATYDYSYDLAEIAAYRSSYLVTMNQWSRQFPGFVLDVDFAALAARPEPEVRRLLEFCGLGWDPACLDIRNVEQRVGERGTVDAAPSPPARLAPYSAIFSPPAGQNGVPGTPAATPN